MIIGVPKEIKTEEYRTGMTPRGAAELKREGHTVLVEQGAGVGSGFSDEEYLDADADVVGRETVFGRSDLIVKVKEPLPPEYELMRGSQAIFTFLHLAPNRALTEMLLRKKITALGYETLEKQGSLPLLTPMSEIAGRMAPLIGSYYLQKVHGGSGVLPSGAVGVRPAKTVILGAGTVGANAARICVGVGMETVVMNRGVEKLQRLDELFRERVRTLPLNGDVVQEEIRSADIVIGALLIPGGRTPVLITREMLRSMKKGSVVVDVSVDQGGCAETARPTTHGDPVYEVDGVIHYMVANMPGAYPRTSTLALTNVTLPFVRELAERGIEASLREDPVVLTSLNTYRGYIVHEALARAVSLPSKKFHDIV